MDSEGQHKNSFDEETLALPLSAFNANALVIILGVYIEENKDYKFDTKTDVGKEAQDMHDWLLAQAVFMHEEALEIVQYFKKPKEPKKKQIILPPNFKDNGTDTSR